VGEGSVQLGTRGVHGVDLRVGNDGGCVRTNGCFAPGSVRDAAVLRVQHGRLFCALALVRATHGSKQAAEDLFRELVSQGSGWKIPLARLWRKQPSAAMDL